MGFERIDWAREAALLRPAKLTLTVVQAGPTLDVSRPWIPTVCCRCTAAVALKA